jgi:hypothetical protein
MRSPPDASGPGEQLDALIDDLTAVVAALSRLAAVFVTITEDRRLLDQAGETSRVSGETPVEARRNALVAVLEAAAHALRRQ